MWLVPCFFSSYFSLSKGSPGGGRCGGIPGANLSFPGARECVRSESECLYVSVCLYSHMLCLFTCTVVVDGHWLRGRSLTHFPGSFRISPDARGGRAMTPLLPTAGPQPKQARRTRGTPVTDGATSEVEGPVPHALMREPRLFVPVSSEDPG